MLGFKRYEIIIAWRYLMSKRRQGGISIIAWYALAGVVIGVATLIIVQAVMIGFRQEFVEKIVGANSHLVIYKKTTSNDLDKSFYICCSIFMYLILLQGALRNLWGSSFLQK